MFHADDKMKRVQIKSLHVTLELESLPRSDSRTAVGRAPQK